MGFKYDNIYEFLFENNATIEIKFGNDLRLKRTFNKEYQKDFPKGTFTTPPLTKEEEIFKKDLFETLAKEAIIE